MDLRRMSSSYYLYLTDHHIPSPSISSSSMSCTPSPSTSCTSPLSCSCTPPSSSPTDLSPRPGPPPPPLTYSHEGLPQAPRPMEGDGEGAAAGLLPQVDPGHQEAGPGEETALPHLVQVTGQGWVDPPAGRVAPREQWGRGRATVSTGGGGAGRRGRPAGREWEVLQGLGCGLWRREGVREGVTRTHWPLSPTTMVTGQVQEPLLHRPRAPQHCLALLARPLAHLLLVQGSPTSLLLLTHPPSCWLWELGKQEVGYVQLIGLKDVDVSLTYHRRSGQVQAGRRPCRRRPWWNSPCCGRTPLLGANWGRVELENSCLQLVASQRLPSVVRKVNSHCLGVPPRTWTW